MYNSYLCFTEKSSMKKMKLSNSETDVCGEGDEQVKSADQSSLPGKSLLRSSVEQEGQSSSLVDPSLASSSRGLPSPRPTPPSDDKYEHKFLHSENIGVTYRRLKSDGTQFLNEFQVSSSSCPYQS